MGLFSIDIEKFYEELKENGQQLKGIFCIQYPIYCIHANITDITFDPLDNFDRSIAGFLKHNPNFTSFQIAGFLGTPRSFVDRRIDVMKRDGLMDPDYNQGKLNELSVDVFWNRTIQREHKISHDFYMDGLTLKPLPKSFNAYYISKLVSENDSYYRTRANGESYEFNPFGPDLVHTPPHNSTIIDNIFNIPESDREHFNIPAGLQDIEDISYTRTSIHLLIAVSSNGTELTKQLVDGFAIYSMAENISYLEAVTRNVRIFEENIKGKIENLVFKIFCPPFRTDREEQLKPILTTNWNDIDRYDDAKNKCFSFSSEDLLKVIDQIFEVKNVKEESIVNTDSDTMINISKETLLTSRNRSKLISGLIRERDYKMGIVDHNVFLLYLYYNTKDEFVKQAVKLKKILRQHSSKQITLSWIQQEHPEFSTNFRQLLIACGEYELLEKLDMEKYMAP